MDAKKCDRCATFYVKAPSDGSKRVHIAVNENASGRGYDICPSCAAQLDVWIKNEVDIVIPEPEETEEIPDGTDSTVDV